MHGTKSKLHETSTKMPLNMVVVFLFSPTMQIHMPSCPSLGLVPLPHILPTIAPIFPATIL